LARQIAERLARRHDIEVLTTTARDYITWRNEYPAGEEKLRGVQIRRFSVEGERNLEEFNKFSDWIYQNPHTREDELKWLDMQGPVVPELVDFLRHEHSRYELLVFFTYLYYPTYHGLQVDPEKSALVPTAHDEPPLKLDIYKEMFGLPSSFIFNTEAEELLVLERFGVYKKMRETIGIGMELLDSPDATGFKRKHKLSGRYLLYAGRIDQGKGCDELIRFFRFYKEERPEAGNLQLILIGKQSMKLPPAKDIRYLGFLEEDEKLAAMAAASAVVVPSRLESLSIVALEAFSVGTPVLVNAGSKVLVDHCIKANAGLFYGDYDEFEQILDLLLREKNLIRGMGRQGQRYIKENFGWEKLLTKYELAFRSSARVRRPVPRHKEEIAEEERETGADESRPAGEATTVEMVVEVPEGDEKTKEEPLPFVSESVEEALPVETDSSSEEAETREEATRDDESGTSEVVTSESAEGAVSGDITSENVKGAVSVDGTIEEPKSDADLVPATVEPPPPIVEQKTETENSGFVMPKSEEEADTMEAPPPAAAEGAEEEPSGKEETDEEPPRSEEVEARKEEEIEPNPDAEDKT
jgi:glycosyltransferase involved in cell wall biosynthesis